MSVEQLFARLRDGTIHQRQLRAAKLLAFASLFCVLASILEIVTKVWAIAIADASIAVFMGYSAFVSYTLSRKDSGE